MNDGWVLGDNILVKVLLREGHGFYLGLRDVNVLRLGVEEHIVVADVVELLGNAVLVSGDRNVVLLGVGEALGHQVVPDAHLSGLDEVKVGHLVLFVKDKHVFLFVVKFELDGLEAEANIVEEEGVFVLLGIEKVFIS